MEKRDRKTRFERTKGPIDGNKKFGIESPVSLRKTPGGDRGGDDIL